MDTTVCREGQFLAEEASVILSVHSCGGRGRVGRREVLRVGAGSQAGAQGLAFTWR